MSNCDIIFLIYVPIVLIAQFCHANTQLKQYKLDRGKNLFIDCDSNETVHWRYEHHKKVTKYLQNSQYLSIENVSRSDTGLYVCYLCGGNDDTTDVDVDVDADAFDDRNEDIDAVRCSTKTDILRVNVTVLTTPGPVSYFYVRASTIIAVMVWEIDTHETGGYNLKSFTAEYRPIAGAGEPPTPWERLDPINIAPNIRQLEVYHLQPNASYEFQIWGNNVLGAGIKRYARIHTIRETTEDDLIKLIIDDAKRFDTRTWIYAVVIVLGTLIILTIAVSIVLCQDCKNAKDYEGTIDSGSTEWIPNIIVNPGFSENDDNPLIISPVKTVISQLNGRCDNDTDDYSSDDLSPEISLTRKFSIFFTGDTIKRL